MQLSPQDPRKPGEQSSPYPQPEQPSTPSPGSLSPTSPLYQPSPYAETRSQFAPPPPLSPPQGDYSPEEERYHNQASQDGGPITQYRAVTQEKLVVPPIPPSPRNGWKVVSLVLFILVLILAATTTTLVLIRPNGSTVIATQPPATVVPGTQPPTSTVNRATPTSTAPTTALVPSGTITENLLLTCGANCNDPIHVTITTVQVDDANGNMIWNISLKNVSGVSVGYGISQFELLASGTQTQISAAFSPSQSGGTLPNSDPSSIQGTFAFVPIQNTTYTLTVVVAVNPYGGPIITFDPVQITNL